MIRITIIAGLAFAAASANAQVDVCNGPVNIPTKDAVAARTARCWLKVAGRLLVNKRCNIDVSPDLHGGGITAGKYQVVWGVIVGSKGNDGYTAKWNRGNGSEPHEALGHASYRKRGSADSWYNRRFEMCMSDYLACRCKSNEYYGCHPQAREAN